MVEKTVLTCPECGGHDIEVDEGCIMNYYICNDCGYKSYEDEDCWEQA